LMVERSLTNYSQDSCREEFVVDGRCFGEGYYGDFCHIGNVFNKWPVFIIRSLHVQSQVNHKSN
jgi:hypothetical protein